MSDLKKALDEAHESNNDLLDKYKTYLEDLEKRKDIKKARQALDSALTDLTSKIDAAKKALEDFIKKNKAAIEKSEDGQAAILNMRLRIQNYENNVKHIRDYLKGK